MKVFICAMVLLMLLACSVKPSDREIESQVIHNLMSEGGSDIFVIENFQKTDGFERNDKTYVAYVSYELVFKKGLKELREDFKAEKGLGSVMSEIAVLMLMAQYGNFEAGFKILKKEKVVLMKTEKGWHVVEDGKEPF